MKPTTSYACKRRSERYWLWHAGDAFVEFSTSGGSHWCCDLLIISEHGVCFGLIDHQPALAPGSRIDGATVRVGESEINGALVIAHVTEEFSAGRICGAEFLPATADDRSQLTEVISGLQKKQTQTLASAPVGK